MRISPTANGLWAMAPERLRVGRRRDASVSGDRDRLQAALRRAAGGRRRRRHRDREHLQRTVPLHRRARADGRRRPHRRAPRDRARASSSCPGHPCARPTSAPAPRSCSPVCGPTARRSCTAPSTSTAATRVSWTSCARWAPTSSAVRRISRRRRGRRLRRLVRLRRSLAAVAVELGLGLLVGDVQQQGEQSDGDGDEQHLVPTTLMREDHCLQTPRSNQIAPTADAINNTANG